MIDLTHGSVVPPNDESGLARVRASYGDRDGAQLLREAIASRYGVAPSGVIVTTGASLALAAVFASLPAASTVMLPRPYYPPYPRLAAMFGLRTAFYELAPPEFRPRPGAFAGLGTRVSAVVVNVPNNPTGAVLCEDNARELAGIGIDVVADEAYAELAFVPEPQLDAFVEPERLIRVRSFSKSLSLAGERLGYVLAQKSRLAAISDAHWVLATSPPLTAQAIALGRISGDLDGHFALLVASLRARRDRAVAIVKASRALRCRPPDGGIYLWIELSGDSDGTVFSADLLAAAGVRTVAGEVFGVPGYVRATFAVDDEMLEEGFARMTDFAERRQRALVAHA